MGVRLHYPIIKREPLIVGFKRGYTTVLYEVLSRVLAIFIGNSAQITKVYYHLRHSRVWLLSSVHFTVTPIL